jgi:hypothetical protein
MDVRDKLQMIIDLWDMGISQEIENFIKQFSDKHKDTPDMAIELTCNDDGEMELSDLQKLFLARVIADDILNNSHDNTNH